MNIYNDFDLKSLLWYKIGGVAKCLLECKSKKDVLEALEFVHKNNINKFFIIGTGSNLVFSDNYFDGAIIYLAKPENPSFQKDGDIVTAYAGEILGEFVQFSLDHNLIGLEWAGGLPGTVGAAVRGNVGAYGGEIKDSVQEVEVALIEDSVVTVKTFTNHELLFSYRHSLIKAHNDSMVVLSVTLKLKQGSEEEVIEAKRVRDLHIQQRKDKHPLEYPNCGSVFKNIHKKEDVERVLAVYPELSEKIKNDWYGKVSMAYLIQKLGLQGYRVGNAQVSEKHALFIVNLGGAKSSDVKSIINTVQEKCKEVFGFTPEIEVEIVEN